MTAIAEFDPEPGIDLTRNLLALLLASAILHGISLSLLRWSPERGLLPSAISIQLSRQLPKPRPRPDESPVEASQPTDQSIEPITKHIPESKRQSKFVSSTRAEPTPKTNDITYDLPRKQWNAPSCTAQQKRTAGHICSQETEPNTYVYANPYEQHVTSLLREEVSASAERYADLRAIDTLLAQQAAVDEALRNFEKPPADLLKEKSRISSEISRIDQKYSSVNLLKILDSTYKTAKKLAKSEKRK